MTTPRSSCLRKTTAPSLPNGFAVGGGSVDIEGAFTTLGGLPRNYIGRLTSGKAALQHLSIQPSGAGVTWTRAGATESIALR